MSTKLTDYLIKLSFDPTELTRFHEDPRTAMQAADLSLAQKFALRSLNSERITDAVIAENVGRTFPHRTPRSKGISTASSASRGRKQAGSLTVVGTGIRLGHLSLEVHHLLEHAEKLFFLANDLLTFVWILQLNPTAESLVDAYQPNKSCSATYHKMVRRILRPVCRGLDVCFAIFGHPGVLAFPAHEAIRRARLEGYCARMLPATSSEDCLFADLGVDPVRSGCHSFEATDFLIRGRKFDTSSSLILWRIAGIGGQANKIRDDSIGLRLLADVLQQHYDSTHETVVYEAAVYPVCDPVVEHVRLASLAKVRVNPRSTLYVPPKVEKVSDPNMMARLGMNSSRKKLS
jgi:hypothetical protein